MKYTDNLYRDGYILFNQYGELMSDEPIGEYVQCIYLKVDGDVSSKEVREAMKALGHAGWEWYFEGEHELLWIPYRGWRIPHGDENLSKATHYRVSKYVGAYRV